MTTVLPTPLSRRLARLLLTGCAAACLARPALAVLGTPGFRVVPVAHSDYPISALAVAPDGRLFAAIQALGRPADADRGPAEIRVYSQYRSIDGSLMDEGTLWATVDEVHPSNNEEGLIGLALAPDFATSKLVYAHVVTSVDGPEGEIHDQEIRVYREKADGTGEYLGTVLTGLELENYSSNRNGGNLAFGVDGCLYLGQGDGGSGNRWSAQTLVGTDGTGSTESGQRCTDICLGTAEYPDRSVEHNGLQNHGGKLLRMAVEGPSQAQGAGGAPFAAQPFAFGAGMRNPTGLLSHPLTGQLFVGERGDSLEAEIDVVDTSTNLGWPCLEGTQVKESCAVTAGMTADGMLANHPTWRRPLVVHPGSNETPSALAAYTGTAYPAEFYGDVFYFLRNSARIYRVDLAPPCFVPGTDTQAPLAFHDQQDDDEFFAYFDIDDDGDPNFVSFTSLAAIAQGPNPQDAQVLYVGANQNASGELTQDGAVFRLEYATAFTPYDGPTGRVGDECFTAYENPFRRPTCLPPGGNCPGAADGTACDDGDACNGAETCSAGVCNHGTAAADGTSCTPADACRGAGTCNAGYCASAAPAADGTPCPDADPCDGLESCLGGVCQPGDGDPEPLAVKTLKLTGGPAGKLALNASVLAAVPVDPASRDEMTLVVGDGGGTIYTGSLTHPESNLGWRGAGTNRQRYFDSTGAMANLKKATVKRGAKKTKVQLSGDGMDLSALDEPAVTARVIVGAQCFEAAVTCTPKGPQLVCKP